MIPDPLDFKLNPDTLIEAVRDLRARMAALENRRMTDTDAQELAQRVGGGNAANDDSGIMLRRGQDGASNSQSIKWGTSDAYIPDTISAITNTYTDGATVQQDEFLMGNTANNPADGRHQVILFAGYSAGHATPIVQVNLDTGDIAAGGSTVARMQFNSYKDDVDTLIYGTQTDPFVQLEAGASTLWVKNIRTARQTLNDDTVYSFTPVLTDGAFLLLVFNGGTAQFGIGTYQAVGGSALVSGAILGSNTVTGAGALTNGTTDGTDGKLNINAATDGKLYIKNRLGGGITFYLLML